MKKNLFLLLLCGSAILYSCKKDPKIVVEKAQSIVKSSDKLIVDSIKIEDSIKINPKLQLEYSNSLLYFPTLKNKNILDSIYFNYKDLKDFSKVGLEAYLKSEKDKYFNLIASENEYDYTKDDFTRHWYNKSSMMVLSLKNDYLQIKYFYSMFEEGAHGNYGFNERVFDLMSQKKVELKDITTMPKPMLEKLLKKNIDSRRGNATDSEGEVKNSSMLLVELIPVTENFYFDDKNLYFHYSPYEIAAYAAGDIVIPISWDELNSTLTPNFKQRIGLK